MKQKLTISLMLFQLVYDVKHHIIITIHHPLLIYNTELIGAHCVWDCIQIPVPLCNQIQRRLARLIITHAHIDVKVK